MLKEPLKFKDRKTTSLTMVKGLTRHIHKEYKQLVTEHLKKCFTSYFIWEMKITAEIQPHN